MIYVTGDTHGTIDIYKLSKTEFPEGYTLTRNDYLIIAGDFGGIWGRKSPKDDKYFIEALYEKRFPWTTLWVDGNHENFDLLEKYPVTEMFGGRVQIISEHCIHLMRGEVYTIDGYKIFTLGGAKSWDKHRRIERVSWWPQEFLTDAEMANALTNLGKHNWEVDYIVTHAMPNSKMYRIYNFLDINPHIQDKTNCSVSEFLDTIYEKVKYKRWFFGHYHIDYQFENFMALFDAVVPINYERGEFYIGKMVKKT